MTPCAMRFCVRSGPVFVNDRSLHPTAHSYVVTVSRRSRTGFRSNSIDHRNALSMWFQEPVPLASKENIYAKTKESFR